MGVSAAVDAHALSEGRVKAVLADPERVLKPRVLGPSRVRRGKIMASEEEAKKICIGLVKRKIFRIAEEEERIFNKEGTVIASGLLDLEKGIEFATEDSWKSSDS